MYLTAAQARKELGVGRDTLTRLIRSGALRASRLTDAPKSPYRISEEDLADYVKSQRVQVPA